MFRKITYCHWLLLTLLFCTQLCAQSPDVENNPVQQGITSGSLQLTPGPSLGTVVIRSIIITGNQKTKSSVVLREVPFKVGDKLLLTDLVKKFEEARHQLINTSLFHEVVVALKTVEGNDADIMIDVKERWYLFPFPYFRPVDRNLNQWLFEKGASLDRVNYGVKLLYNNVTGYNDKLRAWITNGYTKQLTLSYDRIYIDKKLKWGMNVGFTAGKNREVNYNTMNDKQVFLKEDGYVRSFMNLVGEITYRPAIKTRHKIGIAYTEENVKDTVVALNPTYFKHARNNIRFFELYYNMAYYDLDYIPYPTKGYAAEFTVSKRGFNTMINSWQLSLKAIGNWHLFPRSFLTVRTYGTIKLPFHQPYFNQRLLGYNDAFIQGYEYYVVDGVAGGFIKTSITRELFNFRMKLPERKKKSSQTIPFKVYGKIYGNAGYVYTPQPGENSLSNKMLYSGGFGIDILSAYDFTLKLEWTFNQLGENGLFLHRKSVF